MLRVVLAKRVSNVERVFGEQLAQFAASKGKPERQPRLSNFIDGKWQSEETFETIISPMDGRPLFEVPLLTDSKRLLSQIKRCPKSGLFNPLKRPEMYKKWGEVCRRISAELDDKDVQEALREMLYQSLPKSYNEIVGAEISSIKQTMDNWTGDSPRFASKGFTVSGDRAGQQTTGYRFPYGPVLIISPFNLPLKLSINNLVGALVCGNFAVMKPDSRCSLVIEAFVKLMLRAGMDPQSMALLHGNRKSVEGFMKESAELFRMTQFTGSSAVAEKLSKQTHGKIRLEDSGFNWIIADNTVANIEQFASQIDQDAFATSGQKCSALRMLVIDESLEEKGLLLKVKELAAKRTFANGLIVPLLSVTNEQAEGRVHELLQKVKGSKLLFGGKPVSEVNKVPSKYGLFEPTLIQLPIEALKESKMHELIFEELFGPILITFSYKKSDLETVLDSFDKMRYHLTAGIASSDPAFTAYVLGSTVNGLTIVGKARTTGAPANHAFGPSNDPLSGSLGTPFAAVATWTCHREIIRDFGAPNESDSPLPLS